MPPYIKNDIIKLIQNEKENLHFSHYNRTFGTYAGCGQIFPVKISEIYENTYKYEDKTISVKGEVENSISVFGLSGFILSEGGKKWLLLVMIYLLRPARKSPSVANLRPL